MSFFDRQEEAIKRSAHLVLYFSLSVIAIVFAVDLMVYIVQILERNWEKPGAFTPVWSQLFWGAAATLAVIAAGSIYRYIKLRPGGRALAKLVGAVRVDADTEDEDVKRFVNVAEEMSIASGVPLPALYVMEDEDGINAFVAGYGPADTVLVVTKGALTNFTRDELQGVIAHEFSHIFHGDVRLNMDIICLLAGILLVSQLGAFMIRGLPSYEDQMYKKGGVVPYVPIPVLTVVGVVIWFAGAIGLLFGELIQAAVSRQREYLADASAVQYTRNPDGIARALARILRHYIGSRLYSLHAHELRHLCFGETLRDIYDGMFDTHPPLELRIKELDPSLYYAIKAEQRKQEEQKKAARKVPHGYWSEQQLEKGLVPLTAAALAGLMDGPSQAHSEFAAALLAAMPEAVRQTLRTGSGAKCAVYAMLIPEDTDGAAEAEGVLREREGYDTTLFVVELKGHMRPLGPKARLPILDLAAPALAVLDPARKKLLLETAAMLIQCDRSVSIFEYVAYTTLKARLGGAPARERTRRYGDISRVGTDAAILVSAFSWAGTDDPAEAKSSFDSAMGMLGLSADAQPLPLDKTVRLLDRSLASLDALTPKLKERLFGALAGCIMRDNQVMVAEGELLRAVAGRLGCPMPPLVMHAPGR